MSLKDNERTLSVEERAKLAVAIEDYKDGDRSAISRLQNLVKSGIISSEMYKEIIKANEPMFHKNFPRREKLNKEKSRKRKKLIRIILCIILLLSLIASAVIYHLYAIDSAYADGYDIGKIKGYSEGYDKGYGQYKEIRDEYNFFHKKAVIVTATGSKYHRHGCYHIKDRKFYIFNISAALGKGYTPCLDCFY